MTAFTAETEVTAEPVVLYRLYDASGLLLRVGVTENLARRFRDYEAETSWWASVTRRTVEWMPDRETALQAETDIIHSAKPLHNEIASRAVDPRTLPRYPLDHDPEAVRFARRAAGATIRQLAEEIGVSVSLISEIESGNRNATPANLLKIANALGCPVVALERKRESAA